MRAVLRRPLPKPPTLRVLQVSSWARARGEEEDGPIQIRGSHVRITASEADSAAGPVGVSCQAVSFQRPDSLPGAAGRMGPKLRRWG